MINSGGAMVAVAGPARAGEVTVDVRSKKQIRAIALTENPVLDWKGFFTKKSP